MPAQLSCKFVWSFWKVTKKKYVCFHHHQMCFHLSPQTSTNTVLKTEETISNAYVSTQLFIVCVYFHSILLLQPHPFSHVLGTFHLPASPILSLSLISPAMPNNTWMHPPSSLLSVSALLSSSSLSDYLLVSLWALSLIESMPGWHAW